ncbi:MAG: HlyD family efflux transporter periplasmic adaptor subunit [Prevotella sp.]|nr:HlyD family efflux transporter periplasmic adaptor subunit [Prevotella sp.]
MKPMKRFSRMLLLASSAALLVACDNSDKEYDATGVFEATEVTVSAKTTGELTSFTVKEGDKVEQNALLGMVSTEQLKLKHEQLETNKQQLRANKRQLSASKNATDSKRLDLDKQVASIKQQIANAQREQHRFSELVKDGAVPRKQLDDINDQIAVLQRQLSATQDQISSNNASLAQQGSGIDAQMDGIDAQMAGIDVQQAQIRDQMADAEVRAPLTSFVLEKYVEQGEFVTIGKPLLKLADADNMFIRAYVSSAQLENIKVGQNVTVFADYGDKQLKAYDGTVAWISDKSEFTPKTIHTDDERADLVYAVKIAIKNDGYVKIGMYGKVKF